MPASTFTKEVLAFSVVLVASWIAVASRMYVRLVVVKKFGFDDWLIVLTLILYTAMIGLAIAMSRLGLGVKDKDLTPEVISHIIKLFYFDEIMYLPTIVSLKLSITILLLRFAQEPIHRHTIIATMSFYALCGFSFIFIVIYQCRPIAFLWDNSLHGKCIDRDTFVVLIFGNAVVSFITDGIFAIIPIVMIWNIQMNKKTKFSTGLVLSLGLSTSLINISRFFFIKSLKTMVNRPYKFYPIGFLSTLEIGVGVIAASLATIRPLLQRISNSFCNFTDYVRSTRQSTTRSHTETNTDTLSIKFGKSANVTHGTRGYSEDDTHAIVTTTTKIDQSDIEAWAAICSATHIRAAIETEALKKACMKRNSVSRGNDDATSEIWQVVS